MALTKANSDVIDVASVSVGLGADATANGIKLYVDTVTATKAPINNTVLTGNVTIPTRNAGDNSTYAATTAFVQNALSGLSSTYAPINNPSLTGNVGVPTRTAGDSSAYAASTAFVNTAITNGIGFTGANQSLTQNGYQKLPGGLIMQWGQIVVNPNSSAISTFTLPFTVVLHPFITSTTLTTYCPYVSSISTTQIQLTSRDTSGSAQTLHWLVIGY